MGVHNLFSHEALAEICPQLKQLRIEHQLSIEELSSATHLTLKVLRRMENGKCLPYSYYRKLLKFYGKNMKMVIE